MGTSYFINFAFNSPYAELQEKQASYAQEEGFDIIICYEPEDISNYWSYHKEVSDLSLNGNLKSRGFFWKPYIIYQTMLRMKSDDDYVVYVDVGDALNYGFKNYLEEHLKKSDHFIVQNEHQNRKYTNKKCFELMQCDYPKYYNFKQMEAGIIAFRRDFDMKFIKEWMDWCVNPDTVLELKKNSDGYAQHRHDQSILSNLVCRDGLETISIYNVLPYVSYNKWA